MQLPDGQAINSLSQALSGLVEMSGRNSRRNQAHIVLYTVYWLHQKTHTIHYSLCRGSHSDIVLVLINNVGEKFTVKWHVGLLSYFWGEFFPLHVW